jgi:general secretion pathway protein G
MTLIELIVAFTILALLTTMAVPLARYRVQRDKEKELHYSLREIRKAIDDYKDATVAGKIEVKLGSDGYPESLQQLVDGVKLLQSAEGKK